jgi:TolB protein
MPLSQKHKAVFYASLLVLVIVMFFVLRFPYMQVRSIVSSYNRWTDPAAGRGGPLVWYFVSKYGVSKLKRIVAKDCNTINILPDGHIEYGTGYDYIQSLTGKWFVANVNRIILSGPDIEPNDNGYIARTTVLLNERSEIGLADIELFIKKYGGKYLISRIKWTQKNPTDEQLSKFQDMLKVGRYDPAEGFGGRYNAPYTFSKMGFSPDGKKIVFSPFTLKASDIYIVNFDGTGLKRLTNTKYWEVAPQFTPDGKKVMFMCDKENYAGEIYLIDLDGSNYRRLVPNYFGVSEVYFSPDGNCVAFTAAREVYIMNADGSNIKKLTNSGRQSSSLKFSPDGKKLFFAQEWYDNKCTPPLNEEIFSVNIDGTDLKQLTHARAENAWNERVLDITDKYVFFVHWVDEDTSIDLSKRPNDHEVWRMTYDGSSQKKILGGEMTNGIYKDTKVSSDSESIIFVDSEPAKPFTYDLRIKNLNDTEKTIQLTKDGSCRDSMITVSPDGKYIAYMLLSRTQITGMDETIGIRIVSTDGKESRTIADNWNRE